ncbi:helix-turn-helix domain-containing protein [Stratiformator vulcanicus]|uniref:Helix-turn-helix domain protein n=1 Tax=Stratiformator vulcanicus TaxID=2527980 RepID=A0A517R7B7_9PLAN|nr:helix-turn-helix domain-containing protein [Stratiformator vulcanicus]QDT39765.1 Helix-turn-helix domain protein [Stratiformator vulcanicus]
MTTTNNILNVQQVADELGIAAKTVRDLCRLYSTDPQRGLRSFNASPNPESRRPTYRVRREWLNDFIDRRSSEGSAPRSKRRKRARSRRWIKG